MLTIQEVVDFSINEVESAVFKSQCLGANANLGSVTYHLWVEQVT